MKIANIASAGFLLELNNITFLTDPWFKGKGFLNSWAPLFSLSLKNIPKEIDYIWFSHEHPDHFNPISIKLLENHLIKKPKIIFQSTINKRVSEWLKNEGYDVIEIECSQFLFISDVVLRIQCCGLYDSALQIKNDKYCFTHLNDTQLTSTNDLKGIKSFANGKKHIVTSQYGIASGLCSRKDNIGNLKEREYKKNIFKSQINYLKPQITIPSSSAVHFCSSENIYLNKYRLNPGELLNDKDLSFTKLLLPLPGYVWNLENLDSVQNINLKTVEFFNMRLNATNNLILNRPKSSDLIKLEKTFMKISRKIKDKNNKFFIFLISFIGPLSSLNFYLDDLDVYINASFLRERIRKIKKPKKFITIKSDILNKVYKSPYGGDSLIASGCYDINNIKVKELSDHFSIIHLNTAGIFLKLRYIFKKNVLKVLLRGLVNYVSFFLKFNKYD